MFFDYNSNNSIEHFYFVVDNKKKTMHVIDSVVLGVLWSGLIIWGYLINLRPRICKYNLLQSKRPNLLSRIRGGNKNPKILISLWNLFHVYIYICVSFTLLLCFPQRWIEIMIGLLIISFVFEVIEIPFRQQDWTDMIYNFAGILAGFSINHACTMSHPQEAPDKNRWTVWLLLVLLILGVFWIWRVLRDRDTKS